LHPGRLLSAALIPITIAPFAAGSLSPLIDGTFIGMIIIHSYIGFQYVKPTHLHSKPIDASPCG